MLNILKTVILQKKHPRLFDIRKMDIKKLAFGKIEQLLQNGRIITVRSLYVVYTDRI